MMGLAFGMEAFLLGFHEKHNPLDQAVHTLQVRLALLRSVESMALAGGPHQKPR